MKNLSKIVVKPKKTVAPTWLSYVVALSYIADIACIILTLVKKDLFFVILFLSLIVFAFLCSRCFSWYTYREFEVINNKFIYKEHMSIDVFGTDYTEYNLTKLNKVDIKKKKIVLYGEFTYKEPKLKEKPLEKLTLNEINDELINFIETFQQLTLLKQRGL